MPRGRASWRDYAPWEFYLGQMMTLVILIPLFLLAWWITGGPNGDHATAFWVVVAGAGVVAVVLAGRLPPPWNGDRRDNPRLSQSKRKERDAAAQRLLDERRAQMSPDRADDAKLLIDSGFAHEAEELIRSESGASLSDPADGCN